MAHMTESEDTELEEFFAAARQAEPPPSPAFLGRVLADAADQGYGRAAPAPARSDVWARVRTALRSIGGMPGVAALAVCALFGLGLGYTGQSGLDAITVLGQELDAGFDDYAVGGFDTSELEG